jgi:hypothetical protein
MIGGKLIAAKENSIDRRAVTYHLNSPAFTYTNNSSYVLKYYNSIF